jgi:hypothetical protein
MSTTTAPAVPRSRTRAACRGTDPALFYGPHPASVAAAKSVCDVCSVRNACRAHAVDTAEPFGVWGGLAADERPVPPTHTSCRSPTTTRSWRASLVLGHGGHGTTMRALRHGLPVVGMPATGGDQVPITRLLEEWHVGRALPGDSTAEQIRAAVEHVLADDTCRASAAQRAVELAGTDGATLAAASIEALLDAVPTATRRRS